VSGSGDVPEGWELWIVVIDPKQKLYFDKKATTYPDRHHWTAANVAIGAAEQGGQPFEVVPILLDSETSNFMKGVTGYVGYATLPPRSVRAESFSGLRSTDIKPCPS
jgi:hypothetical protein